MFFCVPPRSSYVDGFEDILDLEAGDSGVLTAD